MILYSIYFYDSLGYFLLQMILKIFHKENIFHFGEILGYHPWKIYFFNLKKYTWTISNMCIGDNFEIQN